MTTQPLDDPAAAGSRVRELADLGVTRVAHMKRYDDAVGFRDAARTLAGIGARLRSS